MTTLETQIAVIVDVCRVARETAVRTSTYQYVRIAKDGTLYRSPQNGLKAGDNYCFTFRPCGSCDYYTRQPDGSYKVEQACGQWKGGGA